MTDNKTQPGVRVSKSVWEQFRQDVQERKGAIKGYLGNEVEQALQEYMRASQGGDTHDRLVALEQQLDDVQTLLERQQQTKKDSDLSTRTERKLQQIHERIDSEVDGSPKVHDEVVELAIRKVAGGSKPTIRKYKRLMQEDRQLFEHPKSSSLWFRESKDFCKAVNALAEGGQIDKETYSGLLEEYGREWWGEQIRQDKQQQPDPTFQ